MDDFSDPIPATQHTALAVLTAEVKHIKEAVDRIEQNGQKNVTHSSWEQRNHHVDEKFTNLSKDIRDAETAAAKAVAEVWAEIKSKRTPWSSILALIIAGSVLLIDILPKLTN